MKLEFMTILCDCCKKNPIATTKLVNGECLGVCKDCKNGIEKKKRMHQVGNWKD